MSYGIVLNHHSLPFLSNEDAGVGLLAFFNVVKFCRMAGLRVLLVDETQDKSLMGLELSTGYFLRDWYAIAIGNDKLKDWCRFLKSLETRQPLFDYIETQAACDNYEVGLHGEDSGKTVLLAAYYLKSFIASFTALSDWSKPHIDVWILDLDTVPMEKSDILLNLCDEASLEIHKAELLHRRNALLSDAKNIWSSRLELFPSLIFLNNQIGSALKSWSARQDVLNKARDALNVLELFGSKWKSGDYSGYRHNHLRDLGLAAEVSGESESVQNDPKKKKERMFWLDDGRQVYCENHVKLPDGYRMHFYPDSSQRCIYIVYLGSHLPL